MTPADTLRFSALRQAIRDGEVRVAISRKKLSHIDCPVAADALATRALYLMVALGAVAFWQMPWLLAAVFCAAMLLFYGAAGYPWVGKQMQRTALAQLLDNLDLWDKMWAFGGVAIFDRQGGLLAESGGPDWRVWADRITGATLNLTASSLEVKPRSS